MTVYIRLHCNHSSRSRSKKFYYLKKFLKPFQPNILLLR